MKLSGRVALFAVLWAILVLITHGFLMPRLGRTALHDRFARDQAALAEAVALVPASDLPRLVQRLAATRGAAVTLLAADGHAIASAGPLLSADGDGVSSLSIPGAGTRLLMRSAAPGLPAGAILAVLVIMLAMIAVTSLLFARGLARPLGRLADTAARLGAGDLAARTGLAHRHDELGQVGAAFDAMAQRLAALLEANRSLLASVSHELRTPLARVRVALELASESPDQAQAMLVGVHEDLGELERLIDDILTMTRLGHEGVPPLRRERLGASELVERASRRWQTMHPGRRLDTQVAEAPIDGDAVLLRRVLDNLLDNAARHGPADQPVRLCCSTSEREVSYQVIDAGPGLSDDELRQAFQPFWRSDLSRARDTGGVGLGLALARQIARAHGGEVSLAPGSGGGLVATLRLPRAP